ncbi:MAG TPA: DNA mismatch repair protein, partial [Flavobacterium sp.]|nr:DNA mismatch repair protein [Flavobacterium sp.]
MKAYQDKIETYSEIHHKTNKKYNSISLLRLLSIFLLLFFMFYYIKTNEILYVILAVLSFVGFLFLMR